MSVAEDTFDGEGNGAGPTFAYVARDQTGAKRSGRVSAENRQQVVDHLRAKGLYPVQVAVDEGADRKATRKRGRGLKSGRMTARLTADMIGRLATLTGRRITLDRALGIMAEGNDGAISAAAARMRSRLREGARFSDALREDAGVTDGTTLALVRGAEVSGELSGALETAATILRERLQISRRIVSGLTYPALLLILAVVSVGFIMIAIIPQFRPLVEDRFEMVPPLGRAVFALSDLLAALWPLIATGSIALLIAALVLLRMGRLGPLMSRLADTLPFVGRVIRRNRVTLFLSGLAALLDRDVTLSTALRVMTDTTQGAALRRALSAAAAKVEGGAPLHRSLRDSGQFPATVTEMVRIGEESGELAQMLDRAAQDMKEIADRELERTLTLLQPILIMVVGLLIGVSLYALFSAIVSVNSISF